MAVMSGARYLNAATSAPMSRYDVVCIHTIVGYAPAHAAHFSTNAAGQIIQSRDTRYRSAANLNGNHRVIAIENEDHGSAYGAWNSNDGRAVPGFTEAQIEAIAQICAWAYRAHGIPLVLCPDSRPGSRGIAFHRQGVDGDFSGFKYGGRVSGGEMWSSAYGKVCPGDRRIDQLITRIIPRARQIAGLDTTSGGFLMALNDQQQSDVYHAIDDTHRHILALLPKRYYVVTNKERGEIRAASPTEPGAIQATVLDSLDGNYLVHRVADAEAQARAALQAVEALATKIDAFLASQTG